MGLSVSMIVTFSKVDYAGVCLQLNVPCNDRNAKECLLKIACEITVTVTEK